MLLKLYVIVPICTPSIFELGLACASAQPGAIAAAGSASASFPISRRV
jgi:hypothetical protein